MYISLFTIGDLKDPFWISARQHYLTLLKSYVTLEITPLKESTLVQVEQRKTADGQTIQKHMLPGHRSVMLDATGKEMNSENFAAWLGKWKDYGEKLQFIIGGAYGLPEYIKKDADECLSLSKLTIPHQLAQIVLLEQLYRGCTILAQKKYHY